MEKQWYYCKLTPLGEYFFGGERNFAFGNNQKEKNDYFIKSEDVPSQSTLWGMLRYIILKKNNQLNNDWNVDEEKKDQQNNLIGKEGFSIQSIGERKDYGKLDSMTPLFLVKNNHRYIKTPFNHQIEAESYTPFTMKTGFFTEFGESILPMDYSAKKGIDDSFLCINDDNKTRIKKEDIFGVHEHTRISKSSTEEGFFKKEYKSLKNGFSFGFYVKADLEAFPKKDIVYLGQDKSTFSIEVIEVNPVDVQDFYARCCSINTATSYQDICIYVALGDTYAQLNETIETMILYSIIDKKLFRSLVKSSSKASFKESSSKSQLYQLIKAGSVFYVLKEKAGEFEKCFKNPSLEQIGLNCIVKLTGGEK